MNDPLSLPKDEAALSRFRQAWSEGTLPDLRAFFPPANHPQRLGTLLHLVLIDQEIRWTRYRSTKFDGSETAAAPTPAEKYLELFPELQATDLAACVARGEFRQAELQGITPDPNSYAARFPNLLLELPTVSRDQVAAGLPPVPTPERFPEVPGFRILRRLGKGGMGIVYEAEQASLQRKVALKTIHADLSDADHRRRFLHEARTLARLQHENIVQVYDVLEQGEAVFMVLELVEGGTLADRVGQRALPPRQAALLLEPVALAIAHAHAQGIIHRDLKPANVLLPRGRMLPKVADFGLAKLLDDPGTATRTGEIAGTPAFMAPEQVEGRHDRIGPRTDVYGLGGILYALLTGKPPFQGISAPDVFRQVRERRPSPPSAANTAVPRDLDTICLKCLEKDPRHRYGTAEEVAEDLQRWLHGEPIRGRPVGPAERVLIWMRRNRRLTAALGLACVLGVAAVAAVLWSLSLFREGAEARREVGQRTKEAALQEKKRLQAEEETAEERRTRLRNQLERVHAQAEALGEQADDGDRTRGQALELLQRAARLRAEGEKILREQESDGDGAAFAARWERRLVALRAEAVRRLTEHRLQPLRHFELPELQPRQAYAAAVSGDGRWLAVSYAEQSKIHLVETATGQQRVLDLPPDLRGPAGSGPRLMGLSPKGDTLALWGPPIVFLNTVDGSPKLRLPPHGGNPPRSLRFLGEDRIEAELVDGSRTAWVSEPGGWRLGETVPAPPPIAGRQRVLAADERHEVQADFLGADRIQVRSGKEEPRQLWRPDMTILADHRDLARPERPFRGKTTERSECVLLGPQPDRLLLLTSKRLIQADLRSDHLTAHGLSEEGAPFPRKAILPLPDGALTLEPLPRGKPRNLSDGLNEDRPLALKATVWSCEIPALPIGRRAHDCRILALDQAADALVMTGAEDRRVRLWNGATLLQQTGVPLLAPVGPPGIRPERPIQAVYPRWEFTPAPPHHLLVDRTEVQAEGRRPEFTPIRTEVHDGKTGKLLHHFPSRGVGRILRIDTQHTTRVLPGGGLLRSGDTPVLSPAGNFAVVVEREDSRRIDLALWSLQDLKTVASLGTFPITAPRDGVIGDSDLAAGFSPQGNWLLVGKQRIGVGPGGGVRGEADLLIHPTGPGKAFRIPAKGPLRQWHFDPEEKQVLVLTGLGQRLAGAFLVDLEGGRIVHQLQDFPVQIGTIHSVRFLKEVILLQYAAAEFAAPGSVVGGIWKRSDGRRVPLPEEGWIQTPQMLFRPDGLRCARFGTKPGGMFPFGKLNVEIVDTATGKILGRGEVEGNGIPRVATHPGIPATVAADDQGIWLGKVQFGMGINLPPQGVSWEGAPLKAFGAPVEVDHDGRWVLWETPKGIVLRGEKGPLLLQEAVPGNKGLRFSPDGTKAFLSGGAGPLPGRQVSAGIWDLGDGRRRATLPETESFVGFDPTGTWFLTYRSAEQALVVRSARNGEERGAVRLPAAPDTLTGTPVFPGRPAPQEVKALVDAEGNWLVVPFQGLLRFFDVRTGQPMGDVARPGHDVPVVAVAQHGASNQSASGGKDGVINLWERKEGRFLRHLVGHAGAITGLAFTADGAVLVSASSDGKILGWDTATGRIRWSSLLPSPPRCLHLLPDGKCAVGCADGRIQLVETEKGTTVGRLVLDDGPVAGLAGASGKTSLLAGVSARGTIRIWSWPDKRVVGTWKEEGALEAIALSPDGTLLAAGGKDLRLRAVGTGRTLLSLTPEQPAVRGLCFSPDGKDLAWIDQGTAVRVLPAAALLAELNRLDLGLPEP